MTNICVNIIDIIKSLIYHYKSNVTVSRHSRKTHQETVLIVPFFRRFYRQFLKFLLFPLVLSLLFYLFTKSSIAAGFALGTIASIFLLWNWYCNLERAYES